MAELTNLEAKYLLELNKVLADPNQIIDLGNKKNTLDLVSPEDSDYAFRIDITSNQKIILKTSLHHQESNSHIGLLRIDFKGGHHNPVEVKETVPKFLEEYADLWLKPSEPHMHFFVEGYRPLAWAVPLDHTDFAIKDLTSPSDIADLIVNFAKEVNVSSLLNIQQAIL